MKILLASGCSNTAGTDIDPSNLLKCAEEAWPRWVADHYKIPYVNIAEIGAGNEQISRSIITTVSNLIELDNFPADNIIVAVCWSGFDRYEYWDSDKNKHRSYALSSTTVVNPPPAIIKKYIEMRSLMEPEDYSNYKNLFYIYTTAKILESYGVKYYFSNCLNTFAIPQNLNSSKELKEMYLNMLNLYGSRMKRHFGFFNREETFFSILQPIPRSPYGNGWHWGREGQQFYAKKFIEHMESLNENIIG